MFSHMLSTNMMLDLMYRAWAYTLSYKGLLALILQCINGTIVFVLLIYRDNIFSQPKFIYFDLYLPIQFDHLFISCINIQNKNIFFDIFWQKGKIKIYHYFKKKGNLKNLSYCSFIFAT